MLQTFLTRQWNEKFSPALQKNATEQLENGQILYFPELDFSLLPEEEYFLSTQHADPNCKNISYHPAQRKLWGVQRLTDRQRLQLTALLERYFKSALTLMQQLLPQYANHLMVARTSFRPIQISDRKTSYRKDDKRLHIDAFPSAPNQGKRILRVFCNINPHRQDRIWRTGEPFEKVAKHFLPCIRKPLPITGLLLRLLRVTKSYRTYYDYYMLNLHDHMKADENYQKNALQQQICFPARSSWIVQTDHVSHAAMEGQYVLEQTFYLPIKAMHDEAQSPLRILERLIGKKLV